MDLIVLESNILLKIIFLLRRDILIDVLLIDFVLQLQTILKTTIWPCQQSSDPYRYSVLTFLSEHVQSSTCENNT